MRESERERERKRKRKRKRERERERERERKYLLLHINIEFVNLVTTELQVCPDHLLPHKPNLQTKDSYFSSNTHL